MSFKWKCCYCRKDIIVPYKSPETMSSVASAYCSNCFEHNIEVCDQTGEFYKVEDEDGNLINCYGDADGMIFECKTDRRI